jgi:hypothetical protein
MYSTNVWVATQTVSKKGHNSCKLVMYKLIQMGSSKTMASKQLLQKKFVLIAHQVTHHEDEDHTGEVRFGKGAKGGKCKQKSWEVNLS